MTITPEEDRQAKGHDGTKACRGSSLCSWCRAQGAVVGVEVDFKSWDKRGAESHPFSLVERSPLMAPQVQTPPSTCCSVCLCVQAGLMCAHVCVLERPVCAQVHRHA